MMLLLTPKSLYLGTVFSIRGGLILPLWVIDLLSCGVDRVIALSALVYNVVGIITRNLVMIYEGLVF